MNLIPVFTLLLAYLLLGETLTAPAMVACAAVLAGIGVGQLPSGRRRAQAVATGDESPSLGYSLGRETRCLRRSRPMSDMHFAGRGQSLLSHPLTLADARALGGAGKRKL